MRCLAKDPRQRLRDIGDARIVLESPGALEGRASSGARRSAFGRAVPWMACALLALALALVSLQAFGSLELWSPTAAPAAAQSALHLSLALPPGDSIGNPDELPLAISPDGTLVVYVGLRSNDAQLYIRPLAKAEPEPIAGTEGAKSPFFSPDGRWVGFFAEEKLKKVTVGGTALQVLADAPYPRGGCWSAEGTIYFAPTNVAGIWRVPASGGPATEVTRPDRASGEISHRWPQALSDGETLLYAIWTGPGPDERHIVRQSLSTGERHVLVRGGDSPRFLSPDRLLYAHRDALYAVKWVPADVDLDGVVPSALPEFPRNEDEGMASYAVSTGGTLAYLAGGPSRHAQRVTWVDRAGLVEPLPLPERDYHSVVISPDGRQAIVQIQEGTNGLWLLDFARQALTPFATSGGSSQSPVWSVDGKRVFYRGTRAGFRNLFWKAADGTGEEERLTTKADVVQTPTSVSPDGRWLVFNESGHQSAAVQVWALPLEAEPFPAGSGRPEAVEARAPVFLVQGNDGQVAPDGKWMAYESFVSGRPEIYVQPFPGPGPRQPISTGGAKEPRWSRDGSELFFTTVDRLLVVDVTTAPTLSAGAPRVVFEGRYRGSLNGNTPYDVSADGQRFLRVQQVEPDRAVTHIDVVLNWRAELEQAAR
jgi:serine/threonine-protein kinase